jgi:hypothetical protein
MNNIEGTCTGFWRAARNGAGVITPPKRSCLNVNGVAQWDATVTNHCVRYTCDAVSTNGPDANGLYQGGYGALENGEDKGSEHGFATWNSYTKTNDFLETPTSSSLFVSCITGFRKNGSTSIYTGTKVATPSIPGGPFFGPIQDYNDGTTPTRSCNQIGQWGAVTNACVRIQCPAITPPANPASTSDWQQWHNSGGATFPATNASRSPLRIQTASVATGSCGGGNENLGFFRVGQTSSDPNSGINPTRNCDHMGNWGPVINPCTTQCDATTTPSSGSGMAYWDKVTGVALSDEEVDGKKKSEVDGVVTTSSGNGGCAAGYYPYPYPALNDTGGIAFTISSTGPFRSDSGDNRYLTTIPDILYNDNRAVEARPQRVCRSVPTVLGTANVWSNTSSSCINKCVGASSDRRIGAGKTQHTLSNGTITVDEWLETDFGETRYIISSDINYQNAAVYQKDRTNGHYALARKCNP